MAHSLFSTWTTTAFNEAIHLPANMLLVLGVQTLLIDWVLGVLALLVLRPGQHQPQNQTCNQVQ